MAEERRQTDERYQAIEADIEQEHQRHCEGSGCLRPEPGAGLFAEQDA